MGKTSIEWVRNPDGTQGHSWNPLRGVKGNWHCTKVSDGCKFCYAERVNHRFGGPAYTVGADTIRLDEKILRLPLSWRKPRMVFVCSMTDLFHEDVKWLDLERLFNVMAHTPMHTYQILTKRPERAEEVIRRIGPRIQQRQSDGSDMVPWPLPNVWMGTSCENQEMADRRIPILLQIPAAVRWVSAEPLLGPIILSDKWMWPLWEVDGQTMRYCRIKEPAIDWLVVGGESGPGARPFDPEWGRDLLRQCKAAGVPFFGKQWDKKRELPDDLMVREYPEVTP